MTHNRATVDAWAAANGLTLSDDPVEPGDLYVAHRNGDPVLLECAKVSTRLGCIYPTGLSYPYNIHECVKVQP